MNNSTLQRYQVVRSMAQDPCWNIAMEDYWLDQAHQHDPVLLLWQSGPAVIIGKNQNPWRECCPRRLAAAGIQLARRISGGGAVYHDPGNLNYAFFMPRTMYDGESVFALVARVLARAGIHSQRINRTGLAVQGRKVSGNAFCFRRNAALHHGTLLVQADLSALTAALQPPPWRLESRATRSIPAPVANLGDVCPGLTLDHLVSLFLQTCSCTETIMAVEDLVSRAEVDIRSRKFRSREWIYDQSPPFTMDVSSAGEGKEADVRLTVEHGRIVSARALVSAHASSGARACARWIGHPLLSLPFLAVDTPGNP